MNTAVHGAVTREIDVISRRARQRSFFKEIDFVQRRVSRLEKSISYNQLRQLRPVVRSLSVNATKTLVQAFISCRLDYCNSLLFGISDGLLRRLQSVQNAVARLVTGARRCDHITPVLRQLHWLPVR